MSTQAWKLIEWYTGALCAGAGAAALGLFVPQVGWVEFNAGFWLGIGLPVALLMMGLYRHLPLEKPTWFYGGFALLTGVTVAGLVPLTNPSLSSVEWVVAATLVGAATGVLSLVLFGIIYEVFEGRLPRPAVLVVLIGAVGSTGLTLSDLLGQFQGSLVLIGLLLGALVLLNGLAIQDAMGWRKMTQNANAVVWRILVTSVVLMGVAVLYEVVP